MSLSHRRIDADYCWSLSSTPMYVYFCFCCFFFLPPCCESLSNRWIDAKHEQLFILAKFCSVFLSHTKQSIRFLLFYFFFHFIVGVVQIKWNSHSHALRLDGWWWHWRWFFFGKYKFDFFFVCSCCFSLHAWCFAAAFYLFRLLFCRLV